MKLKGRLPWIFFLKRKKKEEQWLKGENERETSMVMGNRGFHPLEIVTYDEILH